MKKLITLITTTALTLISIAVSADTKIKFALDWKFEGPSAPYLLALEKGYYKEQGLDVTIDSGSGSLDAIPRVASGTYPIGFADINALIKFIDKDPDSPVKAIFMTYDAPPFAVLGRKSLGVTSPKDLEGKTLGAPAADGAYANWPVFVAENSIQAESVTIENVGFPVREPMLAQGKVDAITGYSFSSFINLKSKGVEADDISVMLMTDFGVELYGNTIIVNEAFAKENPDAVKGFITATIKGWRDTVADPAAAVEYVLKRNQIARKTVELERLEMALADNVVTDFVKTNGMGDIDSARLAKAIEQLGLTYEFENKPSVSDIFSDQFLPEKAARMVQ